MVVAQFSLFCSASISLYKLTCSTLFKNTVTVSLLCKLKNLITINVIFLNLSMNTVNHAPMRMILQYMRWFYGSVFFFVISRFQRYITEDNDQDWIVTNYNLMRMDKWHLGLADWYWIFFYWEAEMKKKSAFIQY